MSTLESRKITKEACEWIAKLHGADPAADELQSFHQWLKQSENHRAECRRLAELWGELNILTELAVSFNSLPERRVKRYFISSGWWSKGLSFSVISAVVVLVLAGFFMQTHQRYQPSDTLTFETLVGEQKEIVLSDGSTMLLNTNSAIRVEYSQNARSLYLDRGQAHFDVKKDPQRPFSIYAGNGWVRAVGTIFSVYLRENKKLEVTVSEGSVEVNVARKIDAHQKPLLNTHDSESGRLAIVKAGQSATFDQVTKTIELLETIDPVEMSRKLSWYEGLLKFSGEPLDEVVAEVSRYTPLTIKIRDPAIRNLRIGGFFKVGETEKMFEALESSFHVQVVRVDENLVHLVAEKSSAN